MGELEDQVWNLIRSKHGNHVVQRAIDEFPSDSTQFIINECIRAGVFTVACHDYGCRVLCRLIEHAGETKQLVCIIEAIFKDAKDLCLRQYGHHVVDCILRHGSEEQRHKVFKVLEEDFTHFATHRYGSFVIETALANCDEDDKIVIVESLHAFPPSSNERLWYNLTKFAKKLKIQRMAVSHRFYAITLGCLLFQTSARSNRRANSSRMSAHIPQISFRLGLLVTGMAHLIRHLLHGIGIP